MIPFSRVTTDNEEIRAASKVIESGWLAAGPEVQAFEQEFAKYVGAKYAIFTNSCTSALKMAFKYYKEQGKEYYDTPLNTFCATYSSAEEMGLLDVRKYFAMKDKVVKVTMHYGGVKDETPCDIEDSAHRIEANDPLVGKIRCYSFYATKNMTTGSGGMLVTNDKEIYDKCRLYWRDGLTSSTHDRQTGKSWNYRVEAMAGGYDGNDLAAAIGRVQLRKLSAFTRRRNEIRERYNNAFGQKWDGNHLYPYFVDSQDKVAKLIEFMRNEGVHCGYHYPGTGWLGVSLPIYPLLTDGEVDEIITKVGKWKMKSSSTRSTRSK